MRITFYKYQGTGNDFILIDQINHPAIDRPLNANLISKLCDRKFGIGADGLILLQKHPQYDFEMVYYNPDGSQSLCGNGSRCAVHLANQLGIINIHANFLAIDGPHQAYMQDGLIYLAMHDVSTIQTIENDYFLDNGSPHYVRFIDNLEEIDVLNMGKMINQMINYQVSFQNTATNVNFVKLEKNNQISMRTYERGVNNETLSCGTGAVAAALVASAKGYVSPIHIRTRGGDLQVSFVKQNALFKNIYLIGPAMQVFQGKISV
jgi:diaminopimelate epimerase